MTLRRFHLSSLFLLLLACQPSEADESGACDPGSLNCECAANQLCLAGLECNAGVCVAPGETGEPGDGDPGDGDPGDGDPGDGDGDPGDGDSGDGDGDGDSGDGDPGCGPGLTNCGDGCVDLMSDNNNCGGCDVACKIADDLGYCVDGQCGNTWSECHDASADLVPCSEVCQDEGLTCVAEGCVGGTYLWYSDLIACQGIDGNNGGSTLGCDEPMVASNEYYRCCCAQ